MPPVCKLHTGPPVSANNAHQVFPCLSLAVDWCEYSNPSNAGVKLVASGKVQTAGSQTHGLSDSQIHGRNTGDK